MLRFVSKRAAFPPLGLLTVAALLPADWQLKLVDLNVSRLTDDDLRWADYVMLSAMIVHKASVSDIVDRCRALRQTDHCRGTALHDRPCGLSEHRPFRVGRSRRTHAAGRRRHAPRDAPPHVHGVESARHHSRAVAPLGPDRPPPLCHDVGAVLAGLPVRLRVLRHHRHEWPRPAHQIARPIGRRAGSNCACADGRTWCSSSMTTSLATRQQAKALLREIIQWRARTGTKMGFLTEASANLADDA